MPIIDETVAAENEVIKAFGGKGANQCIACARLTSLQDTHSVEMLGQVGADSEGASYLNFLKTNDVENQNVTVVPGCPTGQAYIMSLTEEDHRNSILIVGGANQEYHNNDGSYPYVLPSEWK